MSAYDPREIPPTVKAACDLLIEEGFEKRVAMIVNDDGTVTLHDWETYVDAVLAARGDEKEEMDEDD